MRLQMTLSKSFAEKGRKENRSARDTELRNSVFRAYYWASGSQPGERENLRNYEKEDVTDRARCQPQPESAGGGVSAPGAGLWLEASVLMGVKGERLSSSLGG